MRFLGKRSQAQFKKVISKADIYAEHTLLLETDYTAQISICMGVIYLFILCLNSGIQGSKRDQSSLDDVFVHEHGCFGGG